MASSLAEEYFALKNRLLKLSREIEYVDSIDFLIEARQAYLAFLSDLRDWTKSNDLAVRHTGALLTGNHLVSHGAGVWFGDELSRQTHDALKKDSRDKMHVLDSLYSSIIGKRLIVKVAPDFYLRSEKLRLSANTDPYDLLDILYSHANSEGFLSYEKIVDEMSARRNSHKNKKERGDVTSVTVYNARRELLGRHLHGDTSVITVRRGEGLIFTNQSI